MPVAEENQPIEKKREIPAPRYLEDPARIDVQLAQFAQDGQLFPSAETQEAFIRFMSHLSKSTRSINPIPWRPRVFVLDFAGIEAIETAEVQDALAPGINIATSPRRNGDYGAAIFEGVSDNVFETLSNSFAQLGRVEIARRQGNEDYNLVGDIGLESRYISAIASLAEEERWVRSKPLVEKAGLRNPNLFDEMAARRLIFRFTIPSRAVFYRIPIVSPKDI